MNLLGIAKTIWRVRLHREDADHLAACRHGEVQIIGAGKRAGSQPRPLGMVEGPASHALIALRWLQSAERNQLRRRSSKIDGDFRLERRAHVLDHGLHDVVERLRRRQFAAKRIQSGGMLLALPRGFGACLRPGHQRADDQRGHEHDRESQ